MRTNPESYRSSSSMTHEPVGNIEPPMAFNQNSGFENLVKIQVNVFCYQKKICIPLRMSKEQNVPFISDLFFFLALVKLINMFWSKTWNFFSTFWIRNFQDPVAKYAVSAFRFATQLKFTRDILRFACKTKQSLLNFQIKWKTTYNLKFTRTGGLHFILCILNLSRSSRL